MAKLEQKVPSWTSWEMDLCAYVQAIIGMVDMISTPMLLQTTQACKIDPKLLITHPFKVDDILEGYDIFARAADTMALKVVIEA